MVSKREKKEADNLALWDAVCTTNPDNTRHVNQRGGFTAINAQSQMMAATAQWGPYGVRWGVRDLEWGFIHDENGVLLEATLDGVFFFPTDVPDAASGSFEIGTDCPYRAGNDTRKKLLTDLTTKALSKLGFNADVFLGMYDDNKYVGEMREKHADAPTPGVGQPRPAQSAPVPGGIEMRTEPQRRKMWAQISSLHPNADNDTKKAELEKIAAMMHMDPASMTKGQASQMIEYLQAKEETGGDDGPPPGFTDGPPEQDDIPF
ncbi:MAG: hypothetical protein GY851_07350 [bacterium]|nr:hypothetical protein [bacterium]